MNRIGVCFVVWCCVWLPGGLRAGTPQGVNLAALEGWDIVIPASAIRSVAYAAEEFQAHYEKASGVRLPIVKTTDRPDRHIFIGVSEAMEKSNVGFNVEDFGEEDLRIVIRNGSIAIAGGRQRGTLYGVYTFLEDYLGVRFLTADHTHVPAVGTWRVVGPVDRFYHPPLAMRWSYYGEINRNQVFAARRRVNTVTRDEKLGGRTGITNISHSFYRQIPSQRYGKEHPEYFALFKGERLANVANDGYGTEPCLTNPDVLKIVTKAVLDEIKAHPQNANVSVSQNDNAKYCRCERCAALDAREGTPMGSLLTFVNAVAGEVAKKYPKVLVGTLSYWYSRKPPKTIKPRPNVQIQLCSIECCLIHPINDPTCPKNREFCRDLQGWGSMTKNVSIWNYNTNFTNYLLPCPNLRVLEPNVRFFVANQATGIFMQAPGNAWAAELSELRNYMISSLIWDPTRSGEQLMNEFLALHYGTAAPPIRRYIDLIHDTAEASGKHKNCFAARAVEYGIDASVAPKALALFAEAVDLADGEAVKRRVEQASIAAYRLAIEPVWRANDPKRVDPKLLAKMQPLVARFLELCATYKVDHASEHQGFAVDRERLQRLVTAKAGTQ